MLLFSLDAALSRCASYNTTCVAESRRVESRPISEKPARDIAFRAALARDPVFSLSRSLLFAPFFPNALFVGA